MFPFINLDTCVNMCVSVRNTQSLTSHSRPHAQLARLRCLACYAGRYETPEQHREIEAGQFTFSILNRLHGFNGLGGS